MAASTGEEFLPGGPGLPEPDRGPVAVPEPLPAPAPASGRQPRHEIRALLRAHLAAAAGLRHLTRHCAVCARLLRLAMEPVTGAGGPGAAVGPVTAAGAPPRAVEPVTGLRGVGEPTGAQGRAPGGRSASSWPRDESPPAA